ncbi:MAG: DUF1648 domain-containing protein [candidate division WOR-3 bacterium]|nr:MAG: DUF1648 domain-containing protein [candidate division WOR-3 bacterium]
MDFRPAKLDLPAIVTTAVVCALLVGLSVFFMALPYGWTLVAIMLSIIVVSYLYSPVAYRFRGSYLIVRKVIGREIMISLADTLGYTIVPDFTKLKAVRTFGNGGLFGYYGTFSTAEYGTVNCQLRSLKNVIILKTKDNAFALSPDDMDRFEVQLAAVIAGAGGKTQKLEPEPPETVKRASGLILILPAVLFLLTVILIYVAYTQLPERIAVHFDLQGNPDGWASRISFLYSGILPATILLVLSIGIFLVVRRATRRPDTPYFIVMMFAVFQVFTAYVTYDTYCVNRYDRHIVPFPYNIIAYFTIIAFALVFYYRKVRRRS